MVGDSVKDIEVRQAHIGDLGVVQGISADAYGRYEDEIGFVPVPAREDYRPRIKRGEVWVLELGGECLGLAVIQSEPDHLLLYSVAIRPERQSRGYGRMLLAFADERAAAAGVGEVRLFTNALMHRNVDLYRRLGFVEAGRRPHPTREGLFVVDMVKRLGG